MAKLVLKKFRCNETTSGAGSDSPYFLVFVGGLQPRKTTLKRIRLGPWHDEVDSGETWPVNHTVVDNHDLALVLCAIIEEDGDGADIAGFFETSLAEYMKHHFNNQTANQTTVSAYIGGELKTKFRNTLASFLSNDDLINVRRIEVTNGPGELTLPFNGDGGRYSVTFAVQ